MINRKKWLPFLLIAGLIFVNFGCEKKKDPEDRITDADGNVYTSVTIGDQVWMKENLRTTHFSDGSPIRLISDNTEWSQASEAGYCWYNNELSQKDIYGALYNWYAANKTSLCPAGWHVSTNDEWTALVAFLGGESVAGRELKEAGTSHWISTAADVTNSSSFTALPGGFRSNGNGTFTSLGQIGNFWSIVLNGLERYRQMTSAGSDAKLYLGSATNGFSVRCVRDK